MKKLTVIALSLFAALAFLQPSFAKSKTLATKASVEQRAKINLNTAGANEIAVALTGVGIKKAQAIVEYRNKHGKFKALEELVAVKGIGVATLSKNETRISL